MRNRVYFNVREKNLSVLDYKTNKVTRKVSQAYLTNAMFVVRKSGNKRVREEGRKNVHAFVNGIMEGREWIWSNGILQEKQIAEYHEQLKSASSRQLEEKAISLFEDFLSKL